MKMEPIVSSETSAIRTQTPGNYPKRNKLHLEHGESLKTRMSGYLFVHKILLVLSHFPGTTDFKMQCVQNFQVITEKLQT